MQIISHRGFWVRPEEKNTLAAMRHSVAQGFGTETDVRDCLGRLVVAHDPAEGAEPAWEDVVGIFSGSRLPLAVNVKADGLSTKVADAFVGTGVDWFAFDMSGPETFRFAKAGLPYFTRHSDIEPEPIMYDNAQGVWLDGFSGTWFDGNLIRRHLASRKRVCIVSPDLHGRDPMELWPHLGILPDEAILCTDVPDKASAFFAGADSGALTGKV